MSRPITLTSNLVVDGAVLAKIVQKVNRDEAHAGFAGSLNFGGGE